MDPEGLKLLTRFCLDFSHLGHDFRDNFQECLNTICACSLKTENTCHSVLHYYHYSNFPIDLINNVKSFVVDFESVSDIKRVKILLYGDSRCNNDNKNNSILSAFVNSIEKTFWLLPFWLRLLFFLHFWTLSFNSLLFLFRHYGFVILHFSTKSLTLLWLRHCAPYVVFILCVFVYYRWKILFQENCFTLRRREDW